MMGTEAVDQMGRLLGPAPLDPTQAGDVETLARDMHNSARQAVMEQATIVKPENLGMTTPRFFEWHELSEAVRYGRRLAAHYILERYHVTPKSSDPEA